MAQFEFTEDGHLRVTLDPKYSVKEFVMREMTGNDEISAATMADSLLSKSQRKIELVVDKMNQREMIRSTLVSVNGSPVGDAPYMELDKWTLKTFRKAQEAFVRLNIEDEEDEDAGKGEAGDGPADD